MSKPVPPGDDPRRGAGGRPGASAGGRTGDAPGTCGRGVRRDLPKDASGCPLRWIEPDWPAPANVRAAATLRTGGVSTGPYASLNLGAHVGDAPEAVAENRRRLRAALGLPAEPLWLSQVHGNVVVEAARPAGAASTIERLQESAAGTGVPPTADAACAREAGAVCVVLTADCLPVLLCDREGTRVAAAHAGWRGLAGGVLESAVAALGAPAARLLAWLGPAIEPEAFEVGAEVREAFLARDATHAAAFVANDRGRWRADLYALARRELAGLGVHAVYGGGFRCHAEQARYFSYRREGRTGRMATLIWRGET